MDVEPPAVDVEAPAVALTPESRAHLAHLATLPSPPLEEQTAEAARAGAEAALPALVAPFDGYVTVDEVALAGGDEPVRARRYRPAGCPAAGAPGLVYLHGGGWVVGTLDTYDDLCRRLAAASGGVVLSVDYRLAPEHPFPAPVEDAVAALRDVLDRAPALGLDASRVAVGGDSAGGTLAAVAARRAADWPVPPIGQLLVYPVTSWEPVAPSGEQLAEDHYLSAAGMRWYWEAYVPRPEDRTDPDAVPLLAEDLGGAPRAHVLVASHDLLRDEGLAYARRLAEAGVPVTAVMAQGLLHGFLRWTRLIPEAARHIDELGGVLRRWYERP
jgi:acetyl esterase